jgi:hypothetical protein
VTRTCWLAYLVAMWLLVEYPYGFALFVLGGCGHWALNSAR